MNTVGSAIIIKGQKVVHEASQTRTPGWDFSKYNSFQEMIMDATYQPTMPKNKKGTKDCDLSAKGLHTHLQGDVCLGHPKAHVYSTIGM